MNIHIESFHFSDQFFIIAVAHLLAVISPGPDFIVVTKQSFKYGRKLAFFTTIGIALGILIHVFYSLVGISYIIKNNLMIFNSMKYLGGLYLCYLGLNTFFSLKTTLGTSKVNYKSESKISSSFILGFMTNVLNPKASLFFLSLFTLLIEPNTPLFIQLLYGIWMSFITFCWFCLVTFLFTSKFSYLYINKYAILIDRLMGTILIIISIKILLL